MRSIPNLLHALIARAPQRARVWPILLSLASGALALSAMYVPHLWWVIFFSLVPFIHAVRTTRSAGSTFLAAAILGSLLIGGATFATLSATVPPSVGLLDPALERTLVALSWMLFFIPLVPTVIAWGFVVRAVERLSVRSMLGLALLWVVLEWARMFLFNIATYAPGVDNPPFFSASFLGYVLADNDSWLQLASLGGVYLLSGAVIAANLVAYRLCLMRARTRRRAIFIFASALLVISLVPVASWRAALDTRPAESVALGFMALYQAPEGDSFSGEVQRALAAFNQEHVDLIVLPEGVSYGGMPAGTASSALVLTSSAADGPGVFARVAELRSADGELAAVIRGKRALAPQGEYVTSIFVQLATMLGMPERTRTDHLTSARWGRGFQAGSEGVQGSVVFCSEVLAPWIGRDLVREDESAYLAFVLAHDQFKNPYTLAKDTLRFLKVRVAEAGVPAVASSRETAAYAFDRFGRTVMMLGAAGRSETGVAHLEVLSTQ